MQIALSRCIALLAVTSSLIAGGAYVLHANRVAQLRERPAPPGGPVRRVSGDGVCRPVAYTGPETLLYADRTYHTRQRVRALGGRVFCRANRHGQALWLLEVSAATTLHALASQTYRLEESGWEALAEPVLVAAAGRSFDRLYARRVRPGRYLLHHGHTGSAIPIFWDPRDARIVPFAGADAAAASGDSTRIAPAR
jgi:hypothetical protein